jgi:hypothetical protein
MTACSIKKGYYDRSAAVVDNAVNDTNKKLSYACVIIHLGIYTCTCVYIHICIYKQIVAPT